MGPSDLLTRPFGPTGQQVTAVGLGGEGILRTYGMTDQARPVIQEAIAQGITYFDSAHVYADSEVYYGSFWEESPDLRTRIFQASKSASRKRDGALADLENTLQRMGTSYLDLWQIHDLRNEEDLKTISGPGGALKAFTEAKSSGLARFIGVTGHHDPSILTKAVSEWPVDAVMMPVNPVEGALGGFLTSTLPAARKRGIAVIAMKVLGAAHYIHPQLKTTPEELIRYGLSHDITVAIVGCATVEEVQALAKAGRKEEPLSETERWDLIKRFEPYAKQLAFYRGVL
ncbi:MAG: aldo/keto reductase [Thermodesulfobacteriota bacterium]|nr:aldo/keto reductase [Thermodesulfobacteriota bacterium]